MKNQTLLLFLLGAMPALAQTPTPGISGVEYAGNGVRVEFTSQPNPFQTLDSARTEVVLVTQLTTSLLSAAALGDNADHPVLAAWASGAPDDIRIPLKPTFRARYFVAACYSAISGGRRIRSPWAVWGTATAGPVAISASPANQEENPEVQVTRVDPMESGALVEARFSLFVRPSSNAEINIVDGNTQVLHIRDPEAIVSAADRSLVVAPSLEDAASQSNQNTRTVLIREPRTGLPTLYRLFHFVPDILEGDTVGLGIIDPDGRVLHEGPVMVMNPNGSIHMGRSVQTLLCHPPRGQANLFTPFTPSRSQDSLAVAILTMAMLRIHVPQASGFEDGRSGLDFSGRYLQAFDACVSAWPNLAGLDPGLPRLRELRTRLLSLASGPVKEPFDETARMIPPVLAYETYTRIVPDMPLMTRPSGGTALMVVVSPNVRLHSLRRTGLSAEFPELINAGQVTGMLFPADSSTLNPMLRKGLYLIGKPTDAKKTTQYGVMQRVIRRPLGIAGGGAYHPAQRVAFPGGMVREGVLQSGLGETAFRIWGQDEKGRWVAASTRNHLMLGGQRRRLVVDGNRLVGTSLHLKVAGPDSVFLVSVGGLQTGKLPGVPKAFWQEVRASDTVGSDTGGIWFRALDWSVEGSGDTVVHRAFEKRGSLLGMLLAKQSIASPNLIRTDGLEVGHLHLRAGDLDMLEKLGATLRITIPKVVKLYNVPSACGQNDATNIFSSLAMQGNRIIDDSTKSVYRFILANAYDRNLLNSHLLSVGDSIPFLHGSRERSLVTTAIEFPNDQRVYLPKSVVLDGSRTRPYGKIVFDFNKTMTIDAVDSTLKGSRKMQMDFDAETRLAESDLVHARAGEKALGALANQLLNFVPMKIFWSPAKVQNPRECPEEVSLMSKNKAIASRALEIDSMRYIRNKSAALQMLTQLSPTLIGGAGGGVIEFSTIERQLSPVASLIVAMKDMEKNRFSLRASRNGLQIIYDFENADVKNIYERFSVFSARKNPLSGPDELPSTEAVSQYPWEDGTKLNESPYDPAGSFKKFDLSAIGEFQGVKIGSLDPAKDSAIVYIHGFNVKERIDEAYQADKNVYKRLSRLGFDGAFVSFHWYGDYTPGGPRARKFGGALEAVNFVNDITNAFSTALPFHDLLYGPLGSIPKKTVMAHSLGNGVTLDMLRLSAYTHPGAPPMQRYVMIEAAVPRVTLMPIPAGFEDIAKRETWQGLFRSAIRPDIEVNNLYNTGDRAVLELAMESAHVLKIALGTALSPIDCRQVRLANLFRIPSTLASCIVPAQPLGEEMAIGLEPITDSYRPENLYNTNARRLLGIHEDFTMQHSYYAFDPLHYTRHVYDRILNRERWENELPSP